MPEGIGFVETPASFQARLLVEKLLLLDCLMTSQVQLSLGLLKKPPVQPTEPDQDDTEWTPLSVFVPQTGDPKPTEILFPDNSSVSIKTWKGTHS